MMQWLTEPLRMRVSSDMIRRLSRLHRLGLGLNIDADGRRGFAQTTRSVLALGLREAEARASASGHGTDWLPTELG